MRGGGGGGEKEEGLGNTFAHCPELHITFKHLPGGYQEEGSGHPFL